MGKKCLGIELGLANIIRAELKAVFATLVKGMEILRAEGVYPTSLFAEGVI